MNDSTERDPAPASEPPHGERAASDLVIRRYQPSDRDRVWELHNAALAQVRAHAGNGPWDDDLHDVERVYLESGGEFLVACLRGSIVAMGALSLTEPGHGELKRMRVDPAFQRRGIGQRLLMALQLSARERGCHTLRLDTTARQTAAQRLYRKNGFRETARRDWHGFEVILFEKRITPAAPAGPEA